MIMPTNFKRRQKQDEKGPKKYDSSLELKKLCQSTTNKASVSNITLTAGPDADPSVEAELTPASNEMINYVEIYDDDNGEPNNWMGDLWYISTTNGTETWKAWPDDLGGFGLDANTTYHVVAYSFINVTQSESAST